MRPLIRLAIPLLLIAPLGCDSAMIDASLKPEVTGRGPKEPDAPGKAPGSGKVDLGEVGRGGPVETRPQAGPAGEAKPATPPAAKPHE